MVTSLVPTLPWASVATRRTAKVPSSPAFQLKLPVAAWMLAPAGKGFGEPGTVVRLYAIGPPASSVATAVTESRVPLLTDSGPMDWNTGAVVSAAARTVIVLGGVGGT